MYLSKLNSGVSSGTFSLPTDAQWEYACRAGTTTPFHYGGNITTSQVNYNGSLPYNGASKGTYREKTTPVGTFSPNRWGLYDMHGNVWEWCKDWHRKDYYHSSSGSDPQGPNSGYNQVFRGGSWFDRAKNCRSAYRDRDTSDYRFGNLGLRLTFSQ